MTSATWRMRSPTRSAGMRPEGTGEGLRLARGAVDDKPAVSLVIPVFNEASGLARLHARLGPVLDGLDRTAEVIYVDDGSVDGSLAALRAIQELDDRVTVVSLARNAGQHAAVLAGFAESRGSVVVTLDADLQNPPEEIVRLLAEIDAGHDVVGTWRESRADPAVRRAVSWSISRLVSRSVGVEIRDCGSMLRAYRRDVVDQVL